MFLIEIGGIIAIVVCVLVVFLLLMWIISTYNSLIQLRNRVKNGLSQIDVQLKRRFDLIPNLVETVKGYAKIEEGIFSDFAKARGAYQQASSSQDVAGMAEASKSLGGVVGRLLMVSEQYPTLKSDKNFLELQNELSKTEKEVAVTRQFYNDIVMKYNNKVEMFPANIIASMFKFKLAAFFEITNEDERNAPKVQF